MAAIKMGYRCSKPIQVKFLGLQADLYHEEYNSETEKCAVVTIPVLSIPSDHELFGFIPDEPSYSVIQIRCPPDDNAIEYESLED